MPRGDKSAYTDKQQRQAEHHAHEVARERQVESAAEEPGGDEREEEAHRSTSRDRPKRNASTLPRTAR